MEKYVVKGFNSDRNVVLSVICPTNDVFDMADKMKSMAGIEFVKVVFLDPEFKYDDDKEGI